MAVEHVSVAVQGDFVARQTRARPVPALAESIWNGLDGDATRIDVKLVYGDLAGGDVLPKALPVTTGVRGLRVPRFLIQGEGEFPAFIEGPPVSHPGRG